MTSLPLRFLLAALLAGIPAGAHAGPEDTPVTARQIKSFRIGSAEQRFGPLEFAGGLELVSSTRDFGALSAIVLADDQRSFAAVADTGFLVAGRIVRDAGGAATGLDAVTTQVIPGADGESTGEKWQSDAEGMALVGDRLEVSFERIHRIATYQWDGHTAQFLGTVPPPVPLRELRQNRGFEGIARAPASFAVPGALVGVTEKSLDRAGNIMGFVQAQDGSSFEFSVLRRDGFDVTDIAFLPGGDLVLLERRFTVTTGVAMRLRRVAGSAIAKGATVDGEILLEADMRYQIDNMEGLAITVDPDGTPRLTIVSDDNHSILQRNLLIEFRLTGQAG